MPIDTTTLPPTQLSDVVRKARAARLLLEELPGGQGEASALVHEAWQLLASLLDAAAPLAVVDAPAEGCQTDTPGAPSTGAADGSAKDRSGGSSRASASEGGLESGADTSRVRSVLSEAPAPVRAFLENAGGTAAVAVVFNAISFVESAARKQGRAGVPPARKLRLAVGRKQVKIAAATGLSLLALWASLEIIDASGPNVWLARFYPQLEFKGTPVRTAFSSLQQDWGRGSSVPDFPKQGFSARFDTCMRLKDDADIQFWLQSKEGSALSIDGRRELSNWNVAKSPIAKHATVHLGKGVHHLSVEYFNQVGQAAIRVRAAINGGSLKPLDHHLLERPIAWPDQVEGSGGAKPPNARELASRVCGP